MSELTGHILVVDDDEFTRDALSRRLLPRGHTVRAVASGPEALIYLLSHAVDVVILDAQMPGMSGLDVLQEIRQRPSSSHLPVLIMTAEAMSDEVVTALELGADDSITKPIDLPLAIARVQTQLLRKRAEEQVRESEERYALAAAGANDGLWDWKISTDEVHFSSRFKDIVGYGPDDIGTSSREWFSRIHPHDLPKVQREIETHLAGLSPLFQSEHRIQHKSGSFRWVLARGVATHTPDGLPSRVAGSLSDIHDGKVVDALTGLPNRLLLLDRLERLFQHSSERPETRCAVLFLDLDGFKTINDSLGHLLGDDLIQAVARRLEGCLRLRDTVAKPGAAAVAPPITAEHTLARLGGDEFIVLLHEVRSVIDATRVAERLQHALGRPFHIGGRDVFTGVSIGIAVSTSGYTQPGELLRDADTAMYRAKALGKGHTEVFDSTMREEVVTRFKTDTALRLGVERHEFIPYFQPIVEFATGRLVGFEALLRWNRPDHGVVSPSQFVSIIEENGLLIPIGRRFLQQVCAQLRRWHVECPDASGLWVNVNFANRQFMDQGLATRILECMEDAELAPGHLVVEITEATAISDFRLTTVILEELRSHGIRVVLDDFGTGYSSLACLDRLPISGLKLDPSLTAREVERPEILRAVVALAHGLGLTVTAEGVERVEQYERLRGLNCEYAQGYLFSRPIDGDAVTRALATRRCWLPEALNVAV